MSDIVMTGTVLGLVFGVIHAVYLYRRRIVDDVAGKGHGIYFAIWTVALWALFGAYLLVFWVIGALGLVVSWLWGTGEAAR